MRFAIAIPALAACLALAAAAEHDLSAAEHPRAGEAPLTDEAKEALFASWMRSHSKAYKADQVLPRFAVWKANLDRVREHNAGNHTFSMGMNAIADLTLEEFRRLKLGFRPDLIPAAAAEPGDRTGKAFGAVANLKAPESVDWRTANAVTPVKDQGNCGSCYTFSSAGALEGAMAIAGSEMVSLSTQQLLDCSRRNGNAGCNGGLMTSTFTFIRSNGGVCPDSAYKYTGRLGTCKATCSKAAGSAIRSYTNVAKTEPALLAAIAQQPIAVAVAAGNSIWQLYKNGVVNSTKCGKSLDHAVLAVAYGSDEKGTPYVTIKNSWGSSWGEDGYIRLVRGKDMCGVNDMASFPNVALTLQRGMPLSSGEA